MSFLINWLFQGQYWLESLGSWALPTFVGIYLIATLIGLPAIFLFLGAGSMFGFTKGLVVVSFADTLSTSACYGLGRTLARKAIQKWIAKRPRFAQLDRAVARKGWKIILLTRLSPIVPSNLLNYGFSLTKINFWHYLFFSWLGMLPVIGLYVYLGSVGVNLVQRNHSPVQTVFSGVGILATAVAFTYTTRLAKQSFKEVSTSQKQYK